MVRKSLIIIYDSKGSITCKRAGLLEQKVEPQLVAVIFRFISFSDDKCNVLCVISLLTT